jgi:hypothetical protein
LASPDRKKEKKKSKLSPPAPPEWAKADQLSVKLGVKHPDKTTNDESESDAAEKTIGRATRGRSTAAAAEGQGQGRKRGKGRREDSESPPPASKRLKRGQQPHSEEEAEEAEDAAEKTIGGSGGENYRDLIGLARGFKAERVQKEGETGVVPMPGVQTIKLSDVQLAKSAWRHPKPYIKAPPPQKEPLLGVGGVCASGSGHVAALREGDGSVIDYECDSVVRTKTPPLFCACFASMMHHVVFGTQPTRTICQDRLGTKQKHTKKLRTHQISNKTAGVVSSSFLQQDEAWLLSKEGGR